MPPTPKQAKLAEAIIENAGLDKPKSTTEVLLSVGYGQGTVDGGTSRITEAAGVQEALEARGFTLENAQKVVSQIMLNEEAKDRDRLTAADMTIKVHGGYAPERKLNLNLNADIEDFKEFDSLSSEFDEKMKRKMLE